MAKKKINENINKYRDNVIYCCKTLDNCRVDLNGALTGTKLIVEFTLLHQANNLSKLQPLSKKQILIYKLISISIACYINIMEPSKRSETTPKKLSELFRLMIGEFLGGCVVVIILILIMSGILALTQFRFNPFAFIQSYYPWMLGILAFAQIGTEMEEKNPAALLIFNIFIRPVGYVAAILALIIIMIGRLGFPL